MLELHGPAASKVTSSANQTIRELETIIKSFTAENMELQKKLNKSEENRQKMETELNNMIKTQSDTCTEFRGMKEFDGSKYTEDLYAGELNAFFRFWGFTPKEAFDLSQHMGVGLVENLMPLEEKDWEPGGEIHKLMFLSDTKKQYLKWLWNKICGRESRLNPDIIQEIVQSWRNKVLLAYCDVERLCFETNVI